jgi:hypothetical protein
MDFSSRQTDDMDFVEIYNSAGAPRHQQAVNYCSNRCFADPVIDVMTTRVNFDKKLSHLTFL